MQSASPSPRQSVPKQFPRVTLACIQCRERHIKCDAILPFCSRCQSEGKQCVYVKSRRGGRRRATAAPQTMIRLNPTIQEPPKLTDATLTIPNETAARWELGTTSSSTDSNRVNSGDSVPTASSVLPDPNTTAEQLLDLYYSYFHAAHQCVLPRSHLLRRSTNDPVTFEPLLLVMQYIGSMFTSSIPSAPYEEQVLQSLESIRRNEGPPTGYHVQAVLLYSIAAYWCDHIERGLELLEEAIKWSTNTGMNLKGYATCYGEGDPVLEESWRRTWWQVYITDAHIAGSTHTYPFKTSNIEMSARLPCEEDLYELGNIPPPRTLEEYDMREFCDDDDPGFSSFAHLIGLTRSLSLSLVSRQQRSPETINHICANADTSITAWCSLLPPDKRKIVRDDGTVDELLFKANMLIHTYIVDLHRVLSTLAYSTVESVCRCAPPAPSDGYCMTKPVEAHIHTSKVLLAIEKLCGLLTLPTRLTTHTPFIICMIANTTIAHLSACRYLFRDRALQMEREKIRLAMGVLKTFSEHWPLGKRTYREIGIIAREILSLADQDIGTLPTDFTQIPVDYPNVTFGGDTAFDVFALFEKSAAPYPDWTDNSLMDV
ncbi:hypothetical protein FQN54_007100 [Arachnomyces sp. PD_36]|nr:hypothetical protein FQN54_007100 [Arachnomyces sp. PD_36]